MAGQRPELKIAIKDVDGGDRTYLLAFWRRDNGRLSGSLDSKVKGIVVHLEDGTKIAVHRKDGKHTHWIDAFEERGDDRAERQSRGGNGGGRRNERDDYYSTDDFGSDDIPF